MKKIFDRYFHWKGRNWLKRSGLFLCSALQMFGFGATAEAADLFQEKVAPILESHCLRCHYPGNEKGDISLATPGDLREGGYLDIEMVINVICWIWFSLLPRGNRQKCLRRQIH